MEPVGWGNNDVRDGTGFAFEKSPEYARKPWAMEEIAALLPSVRLVLLLREPASRAYSHFRMRFAVRFPALHSYVRQHV